MSHRNWLLPLTLFATSVTASAYTIDDQIYFAYAEGQSAGTPYVLLLSKRACPAKGAPKSAQLAQITYLLPYGGHRDAPACWYFEDMTDGRGKHVVAVCTTYGNAMDGGSAACTFASPSRFFDTSTLPSGAGF